MPDIENSRKPAEKGAEWVTVRQPKNSRKNSRNTRKTAALAVFEVLRLFFRLFFGCFTVTRSAPFTSWWVFSVDLLHFSSDPAALCSVAILIGQLLPHMFLLILPHPPQLMFSSLPSLSIRVLPTLHPLPSVSSSPSYSCAKFSLMSPPLKLHRDWSSPPMTTPPLCLSLFKFLCSLLFVSFLRSSHSNCVSSTHPCNAPLLPGFISSSVLQI